MTSVENGYVSSSLVKEIAAFGGDVSAMVPAAARRALRDGARASLTRRRACDTRRQSCATRAAASLEGTPIDIIFLVERLESLIANGKKLPLTTNVVVDQNAALGLIDELRVAVPEEVRAAKRINAEGERIIEKAQDEAERIVARAQEQAAFLIDERGLTQAAEAESRRIIAEAHDDADEIRRGADEYAVSVLVGLEGDVVKTLQSIKKGIALLDERRAELAGRRREDDGRRRPRRYEDDEPEPPATPGDDASVRRTGRSPGTSRASWPTSPAPSAPIPSPASRSTSARTSGWPQPIDGASASSGRTAGSSPTPTSTTALDARVQPLPARARPSRSTSDSQEEYLPSLDLATGRPLPTDDEPDVAAPDRPPRARPRDAGPRGDLAGRADRAALPAGLPGPVHRLRRAPRRRRPRPSRRRHRPAAGGAAWLPRRGRRPVT